MKVGLALLAALLISSVTPQPAQADESLSELFKDDSRILDSDSLTVESLEPLVLVIDVDQRFFNPAGNEQFGLGMVTTLTLGVGQQYVVPTGYARYDSVACSELGVTAPDDLVAEGTGIFTASTSGTHLACYQQQPGSDGGPGPGQPDAEVPEVLDEIIEDTESDVGTDDVGTDDGAASDNPPSTGQEPIDDPTGVLGELSELGRTGANTTATFVIGFVLVVSGGALLRWRRRNTGATSTASS